MKIWLQVWGWKIIIGLTYIAYYCSNCPVGNQFKLICMGFQDLSFFFKYVKYQNKGDEKMNVYLLL